MSNKPKHQYGRELTVKQEVKIAAREKSLRGNDGKHGPRSGPYSAAIAEAYSGGALDDYVAARATRATVLDGTPLGEEMWALSALLCGE